MLHANIEVIRKYCMSKITLIRTRNKN